MDSAFFWTHLNRTVCLQVPTAEKVPNVCAFLSHIYFQVQAHIVRKSSKAIFSSKSAKLKHVIKKIYNQ